MWPLDVRVYVFLLSLGALLLVASLATVSPAEPMFLVTQSELLSLQNISASLKESKQMLSDEVANWKSNSQSLELELENSSVELSMLTSELNDLRLALSQQSVHLTELGRLLDESQTQATASRLSVLALETESNNLMSLLEQSNADLSRMRRDRDMWRMNALGAAVLGIVGWVMVFLF